MKRGLGARKQKIICVRAVRKEGGDGNKDSDPLVRWKRREDARGSGVLEVTIKLEAGAEVGLEMQQ